MQEPQATVAHIYENLNKHTLHPWAHYCEMVASACEAAGRRYMHTFSSSSTRGRTNPSLCRPFACNQTAATNMNRQYITQDELHMSNPKLSSWRHQVACHVAQLHRNEVKAQMQSHTFPQALLLQPRATNATAGAIVPPICANQTKIN